MSLRYNQSESAIVTNLGAESGVGPFNFKEAMFDYAKSVNSVLKVLDTTPSHLTLSTPSKISKKKNSAFSLPAGPEFSCPGATDACKDCYAKKGRHVFKSVHGAFARNWEIVRAYEAKKNVYGLAHFLADSIPDNREIFRIHESGDFHSQFMVDVWTEVVRMRRDISFWTYTRSFDFNYSKLVRQPNIRLWASTDEYNSKEARQFTKKYKRSNVRQAYGPWGHDKDIPDNSFVCPVTNGKLKLDGACEECMLCVTSKTNKNVVFLAH